MDLTTESSFKHDEKSPALEPHHRLIPSVFGRTQYCTHKRHSCFENTLTAFLANFSYAFMGSTLLQILPPLFRRDFGKVLSSLLKNNKIMASTKLGLFIGLLSSVYKLVLCSLRRLFRNRSKSEVDKICAPIAGFCAGISMILDPSSARREFFAVTALARLIDSGFKKAEGDEIIPRSKNKEFWFFIFANFVSNYWMGCSSDVLNKGVYKFYGSWS